MEKKISSFPKIYLEIMHDLMAHAASNNAQTTIEALKNLYFKRKEICSIEKETLRNDAIFKNCHIEIDPGFCSAETVSGRQDELNEKIQLLIDAYEDARENNYLDHFFLSAFESDARLNHRLEHLRSFYQQHKGRSPQRA